MYNSEKHFGHRDAFQVPDPSFVRRQRHECRPWPTDRVSEHFEPVVTIARRAATWIALSAGGNDQFLAAQLSLGCRNFKAVVYASHFGHRLVASKRCAAAMQPPE